MWACDIYSVTATPASEGPFPVTVTNPVLQFATAIPQQYRFHCLQCHAGNSGKVIEVVSVKTNQPTTPPPKKTTTHQPQQQKNPKLQGEVKAASRQLLW